MDWSSLGRDLRTADLRLLALAVLLIYSNNLTRALRWSIFLRPAAAHSGTAPTAWWTLIGAQFLGFASLALFGRLGELVRPLLIARRTGLTASSQIAVLAVERIVDLGAFATLFSLNLLLSPALERLPYHDRFRQIGMAVALLTLLPAGFAVTIRTAGGAVARWTERSLGLLSNHAGRSAAQTILAVRSGLGVFERTRDAVWVAGLSVILWISIALAYLCVMKAFPAPVKTLGLADCLILMGFSVAGNLVQLPGIGGGSQLLTVGALTTLFAIPPELAAAAGLTVWLIGSWSIVPAGLLFARVDGISLKQVAQAQSPPI